MKFLVCVCEKGLRGFFSSSLHSCKDFKTRQMVGDQRARPSSLGPLMKQWTKISHQYLTHSIKYNGQHLSLNYYGQIQPKVIKIWDDILRLSIDSKLIKLLKIFNVFILIAIHFYDCILIRMLSLALERPPERAYTRHESTSDTCSLYRTIENCLMTNQTWHSMTMKDKGKERRWVHIILIIAN